MTTTANGRTVLVTGGSRGIGAAIAKQLAGIGMNVVINYASDEGAANEVVRSITADGGVAIAVKGDVSKSDQFAHLFDQAELRFGGIDMLVNSAGLMSPMPIADVDEEKFDRLFAINVRGVLNGCKLAAKRLRDGGRIVNISTSVIGMSPPGYGPLLRHQGSCGGPHPQSLQGGGPARHSGERRCAGPDRHRAAQQRQQ